MAEVANSHNLAKLPAPESVEGVTTEDQVNHPVMQVSVGL